MPGRQADSKTPVLPPPTMQAGLSLLSAICQSPAPGLTALGTGLTHKIQVKGVKAEAGKRTQSVERLLCELAALSLIPKHPQRRPGVTTSTDGMYSQGCGQMVTGGPWGFLASLSR